MSYYPPLPEGASFALDIILRNLEQDPEYLEDAPYTDEEVEILSRLAGTGGSDEEEPVALDGNKWDRLERESNTLFQNLTELNKGLGSKDHSEKMAYFRTATALLDKIVGIQERATNLRQIAVFHNTVMAVMEETLEPGQRTEVMERLRAAQTDG